MEKEFWMVSTRFLILALAIIGFCVTFYFVFPLVYPFLFGLLLALMFNPVVNWLQRRARFPRWLAVILTILLFISLLATLLTLVIVEIVNEVNKLQDNFQEDVDAYIMQIENFIMHDLFAFYDQFTSFYSSLDGEIQRNLENYVENLSSGVVEMIGNGITGMVEGIIGFVRAIPLIATAFIFSLLASFFFSKDWQKWDRFFNKIVPFRVKRSGVAVIRDLRNALFGFIRAQLILMSVTFVIILIGLTIMQVEYALTLSMIMGLLDLIPYLGPGLIFVPWIIYLFITGEYALVIGLCIVYGLVILQRQMLEPKILGDNVGLDPLVTLFALFVGFSLFGMVGLIVGPVSMVLLGALYRAGIFREMWGFVKGSG